MFNYTSIRIYFGFILDLFFPALGKGIISETFILSGNFLYERILLKRKYKSH